MKRLVSHFEHGSDAVRISAVSAIVLTENVRVSHFICECWNSTSKHTTTTSFSISLSYSSGQETSAFKAVEISSKLYALEPSLETFQTVSYLDNIHPKFFKYFLCLPCELHVQPTASFLTSVL
jgi:hypothetical protein